MVVYSTTEDLTDEEIIAKGIKDGAALTSQVINRVDEDTQLRREQKRRKELELLELQTKQQMQRLEEAQKAETARAILENQQDLVAAGFDRNPGRWPLPGEVLYDLDRTECLFGCSEEVRYIYNKSPNLTSRHSLTLPYSKSKDELHLCANLDPQSRVIFSNLIRIILDLRAQLVSLQQSNNSWDKLADLSVSSSLR